MDLRNGSINGLIESLMDSKRLAIANFTTSRANILASATYTVNKPFLPFKDEKHPERIVNYEKFLDDFSFAFRVILRSAE
jgi:hypothetical protein